jgi:peptide/nickel transport system permease protein
MLWAVNRRYLVRRVLQVVPTLFGILIVTFLLVHVAPNEPARDFAGEGADQAQIDAASSYLGLDRPLPEQFVDYVGQVLHGDFGTSFAQRQPVNDLISARLPATLLLAGSALVLSTLGGIALGLLAARRPHSRVDLGVNTLTLLAYSLPAFWLAQLVILGVALKAGLLPASGMSDSHVSYTGLDAVGDTLTHLVLPALVLAVSEVALLARVTRTGLLAQKEKGYLRAARAKGVSEEQATSHHALPNALLPVITVIGSRVGFLVSGAVLVETVFAWPGLGRLLVDAGQSGDHPVILGMVLLISFAVIVVNLVTDLVYAWVDPRIRYR